MTLAYIESIRDCQMRAATFGGILRYIYMISQYSSQYEQNVKIVRSGAWLFGRCLTSSGANNKATPAAVRPVKRRYKSIAKVIGAFPLGKSTTACIHASPYSAEFSGRLSSADPP